jgi:hypothetical protein
MMPMNCPSDQREREDLGSLTPYFFHRNARLTSVTSSESL